MSEVIVLLSDYYGCVKLHLIIKECKAMQCLRLLFIKYSTVRKL